MAERLLTDADLRGAKPDALKDLYLSDGGGLYARVLAGYTPKTKRIQFVYRYKIDGKTERYPCGTYPVTTLAEARKRHAAARKIRDAAESPLLRSRGEKTARIEKAQAEANERTVQGLFGEWEKLYLSAHRKDGGALVRQFLESDVLAHIGDRKARSIIKEDVVALLDRIVERGARRKANAILSLLRQMFSWGVVRGSVTIDPTHNLLKKHVGGNEQTRDRTLSPTELSELAKQLSFSGLPERAQIAVWLLLATGVRVGELLSAKWTDIEERKRHWRDDIVEGPTWVIRDTKNGEPHLVHLSDFASALLKRLEALGKTAYLFEGRTADEPVAENWLSKMVRDRQRAKALKNRSSKTGSLILSGGEWRVHDLRRTMATRMQALGVSFFLFFRFPRADSLPALARRSARRAAPCSSVALARAVVSSVRRLARVALARRHARRSARELSRSAWGVGLRADRSTSSVGSCALRSAVGCGGALLPHVVEKCLNHKLEGILAVYQKDGLMPERKDASRQTRCVSRSADESGRKRNRNASGVRLSRRTHSIQIQCWRASANGSSRSHRRNGRGSRSETLIRKSRLPKEKIILCSNHPAPNFAPQSP